MIIVYYVLAAKPMQLVYSRAYVFAKWFAVLLETVKTCWQIIWLAGIIRNCRKITDACCAGYKELSKMCKKNRKKCRKLQTLLCQWSYKHCGTDLYMLHLRKCMEEANEALRKCCRKKCKEMQKNNWYRLHRIFFRVCRSKNPGDTSIVEAFRPVHSEK